MNQTYSTYFFDEFNKENGGGDYRNRQHWMPFFSHIAEQIIAEFHPETVLDAGCACGYLVEALRDRGVEAYGIDISEYAIGEAREDIRQYLYIQSLTEKLPPELPKQYDMVVSIEVLEHMQAEDGEAVLQSLCSLTDTFIFSSTDSDIDNITHVNVQRKEHWARLFAKNGFYRNMLHGAEYISPQADVYHRRTDVENQIQQYEIALRIEQTRERVPCCSSRVYYDTGNGFSELCRIEVEQAIIGERISFETELPPDTAGIRFDPVEGTCCIVSGLEVWVDGVRQTARQLNGEQYGDDWLFLTPDPQIQIEAAGKQLKIQGRICLFHQGGEALTVLKGIQTIKEEQSLLSKGIVDIKELMRAEELARAEELVRKKELEMSEELARAKELVRKKELEMAEERARAEELVRKKELEMAEERARAEELVRKKELEMAEERARAEELVRKKELEMAEERARAEELAREKERARAEELVRKKELARIEELARENEHLKRNLDDSRAQHKSVLNECRAAQEQLKGKERLQKELDTYKLHYNAAMSQYNLARKDNESLRTACSLYTTSFCWRITKPVRLVGMAGRRLLQMTYPGRCILKGLHSLRRNGIKQTWDKTVYCLSRKNRLAAIGEGFHLSEGERKEQEQRIFQNPVVFSILVPLYNTPLRFLEPMIESVRLQTYSNWELCLADGSDSAFEKKVGAYCKKMQKKDGRIKYKKLTENAGISENTNACIDMATGDYIGLFDHDDLLHPSALYKMMCAIEREQADFLYTDEATFEGEVTNIITAHFKPDYAIDTLRGNNYICHFSVFKKSLLEEAGRFRSEYDGSQDHDLILRLTKKAKKVYHIPEILYYWRSHPASVAADISSKTYAIDAGKRAVRESIEACGEHVQVESSRAFPTIYRLRYELKSMPLVSIIIPCKDRAADTQRCISSILQRSTYKNIEIIIVDNASIEPDTYEFYKTIETEKNIRIIHWDHEFNYAAINNYAVKNARGEYVLLLNNDTQVITPEWVEELLMYAQREDVGAVGAKLYYADDTIQHAGIILGIGAHGVAGHAHYRQPKENLGYMGRLYYAQDMSAVTGACMLVRKELYNRLDGLDEKFAVAYNDVDFCLRIRKAGYLVVFTPYAELYHFESCSRGPEEGSEKQDRFQREVSLFQERWKKELEMGDPYFNPNFRKDRDDFTIGGKGNETA